jgi:alpha-galactosidase
VHLAWSGNAELVLEHRTDGRRAAHVAELLLPGEVVLVPGETYRSPTVHGVWGDGLVAASRGFHAEVRRHLPARPRPVTINTWEAVYFDHDRDVLRALAERAASVGVERFVLDDGWFGGRRDDTAGLGDWWVSPEAHPDGLAPLIDHVRSLGMEFGLWVEPEMVNPDSDLHRAHPDWVLGDPEVLGRQQLVLDLSIEACWQHLHGALDRLLADHEITYLKWDMNRDLAGAGAHRQVHALYRLLDALRASHPEVEIESCASGGGRADLAILQRTCRIWASDCNDALERQVIQRGWSHLLPPEVVGAHIGPPRAHTTGRAQRLSFRAATAVFGHLGIEWNLLEASDRHLDALRWWIDLHLRLRDLLHGGTVVRLDPVDDAAFAHGVVAPDRSQALFSLVQLTQSRRTVPAPVRLAALDPERTYRVAHVPPPGDVLGWGRQPAWLADGPVEAPGRWLMEVGLQPPLQLPESAVLVHLT